MIYITSDSLGHGIYLDLHRSGANRKYRGSEQVFEGLIGNGVTEVPVRVRSWQDYLEIAFGGNSLFQLVEEKTIRRMLGDVVRDLIAA